MAAKRIPRESPLPPSRPDKRAKLLALWGGVAIAATAIAAYSRTFSVPFVFDDIPTIVDNASIRHWGEALRPPIDTTAGGRPVLNFSFAANYAVSGAAVWSYHALNLTIHILAGLTLFSILRRTLAQHLGATGGRIALFASLLWTLHPLQTESVTYIVQRAESLMGLFYLLTLYCFIRGAGAGSARDDPAGKNKVGHRSLPWFGFSCLACVLGMATKEVMVSAPLMMLLYDRTFLAGSLKEAWNRRKGVYGGLGATWLILVFLVLATKGRAGSAGFGAGISFWTYLPTQFLAISRYLKLSVWPDPLVFYYGVEQVKNVWLLLPSIMVVMGVVLVTGWALLRPGYGSKVLGFAGAWFLSILAPTCLVPVVLQTAAEHRMYLALVPLVVLVVTQIYSHLGRWAWPCCLLLALALGGITFRRNEDYRTVAGLWADTAAKCPENAYAYYNLGYALEKEPQRLKEALAAYQEALRLMPTLGVASQNLGNALMIEGRVPEAVAVLEAALRLNPNSADAHNNLGSALQKQPGRAKEAIAHFQEALRLAPEHVNAHVNLGNSLRAQGRTAEAVDQYREALRLQPDDAEVHYDLANALAALPGRLEDAITEYHVALRFRPGFAEAHNNLGGALSAANRPREAIEQFEEALRLKPDIAEAHSNLGRLLNSDGRNGEALAHCQTALRLRPDFVEAHFNLGNVLVGMPGRMDDAAAEYRETLRLQPDHLGAHFNLALVLLNTVGRRDEAVIHLEAVLRLQPGNETAKSLLAKIQGLRP